MKTVLSVASARPNFVKLAAVHYALAQRPADFHHVIVHTGQHYDPLLSDIFFTQLNIPDPQVNLGVAGGERLDVIERTHQALLPVLQDVQPDIVLVYGDVNGAVGAARAARALGIRIGHVEAGLRSYDKTMPEELNRIEIDGLADVLFCSERSGMEHLEQEKVSGQRYLVGNTMIDTLSRMQEMIHHMDLPFTGAGNRYAVVTLHRPANVDHPETLHRMFDFLNRVAQRIPLVFPVHPRLKHLLEQTDTILSGSGIHMISPLGYLEFVRQMQDAAFILTDSGGIQEEAVLLGKRCFTLRRNTERPSTVESGSNVLIDPDNENDRETVLAYAECPMKPRLTIPDVWDGKAGERIVDVLATL